MLNGKKARAWLSIKENTQIPLFTNRDKHIGSDSNRLDVSKQRNLSCTEPKGLSK